jgi:hypothetical protein
MTLSRRLRTVTDHGVAHYYTSTVLPTLILNFTIISVTEQVGSRGDLREFPGSNIGRDTICLQ